LFDLVIRHGRVIDPGAGVDRQLDVGFRDGRVAALEPDLPVENVEHVVDASNRIVVPGLIDLHTHVYWGGTSLGVDADALARRSGTTTFVDAGSAGPGNFPGFRHHVIERSRSRIIAYLNISFAGIYGFSRNVMVGECREIMLCDAREAVACVREHRDSIVGMKVRVGRIASGSMGVAPMDIAMEAADRLGIPLMAHLDYPPPSRTEVVNRLRRGDVLTHCFKPFPNDALDGRGKIREEILAARERGVWFDIGHGMGSLDFEVARAMLAEGFPPDVISSDVHALCVEGPAYDLLVTLSKFLCLGMDLTDLLRTATTAPAAAISRPDLGSLQPGAVGDAAILELREGRFEYIDSPGQRMVGDKRLVSHGVVIGGKWWATEADEL
jgi:dihydroorotase